MSDRDFDLNSEFRDDVQKFRKLNRRDGMDWSLPAFIELAFGSLTAVAGLAWLVSLWWVPDVIPGTTWMGLGMLGLVLFGGPAALVYGLRRGGADVVRALVRDIVR